MGFFSKLKKVVAKFDIGHQMGKKMGLPDPSGDFLYGKDKALSPAESAAAAQKATQDQAAQLQQQQQLMQSNFAQDLKGENISNVVAGGSASVNDALSVDPRKKKKGLGLAATIGLG